MLKYGCEFIVKTSYRDNSMPTTYERCADVRAAIARAMIVYTDMQMYYERLQVVVEAMAADAIVAEDGTTTYEMLELLWTSEDYLMHPKYKTAIVSVYSEKEFMFEAFRKAAAQGSGLESGFKKWHDEQVADGWSGKAGAMEYRDFSWPNSRTGGSCVFSIGRVEYPVILKKVKDHYEAVRSTELFYVKHKGEEIE